MTPHTCPHCGHPVPPLAKGRGKWNAVISAIQESGPYLLLGGNDTDRDCLLRAGRRQGVKIATRAEHDAHGDLRGWNVEVEA